MHIGVVINYVNHNVIHSWKYSIIHYPWIYYDLQKLKVLHFTFFIGGYDFLKQHKTIMKARWQGGIQLKQVVDETCNNAKNYMMTTTPPFKLTNFVKEEEHGGVHIKF